MNGSGLLAVAAVSVVTLVGLSGCSDTAARRQIDSPVLSGDVTSVHDPALIHRDGRYWLFSTSHVGEAPGLIHVRVSDDLRHWRLRGAVFAALPGWAERRVPGARGLWAPDIARAGDEYRLYYSVSTFGRNDSAIGLAVTDSLDDAASPGRWVDRGEVVSSRPEDDFNAIDPNLFIDHDGRHWLLFGSFWSGIRMVALDPASGRRSSADRRILELARRPSPGAVEAPFLIARDGRYYLFVSFDFCCRGADSSYHTVVGRADDVTGPYVDRDGRPMLEGGGTVVLDPDQDATGRLVGPGHVAILQDPAGDRIVHHAYDTAADGLATLRIEHLVWSDDGWPAAER